MKVPSGSLVKKYEEKDFWKGYCVLGVLGGVSMIVWLFNANTPSESVGWWGFCLCIALMICFSVAWRVYDEYFVVPQDTEGFFYLGENDVVVAAAPGWYWFSRKDNLFFLSKGLSRLYHQRGTMFPAEWSYFSDRMTVVATTVCWEVEFTAVDAKVAQAFINWYNKVEAMSSLQAIDFLRSSAVDATLPFRVILPKQA